MSTIMPTNELIRRALAYLDECLVTQPGIGLQELLDKAGMRFNLSPKDAADLERFFLESLMNQANKK